MANDKDININFKTSADTSGAKAAEDAIKKVKQAESDQKPDDFNPMVRSQEELDAHIERVNQAAEAAKAHEEALRKEAQAMKNTGQAAQGLKSGLEPLKKNSLPPLSEASIAAENIKKLTESSTNAVGGNNTGLKGLAQGLRGVVSGTGAGGGGGGLVGMVGSLIGVLNPIGLVTAAVGLVAGGLMKWKRSLDEAEAANEQLNIEAAESARVMEDVARADALAAEAKSQLREAQNRATNEINSAIVNIGNYNTELQRSIELEAQAVASRKALAAEKLAVAIAEAGDDPVKVNELRQQARQIEQSEELADLDNQIAAEKKRQVKIQEEITQAMEQKRQFEDEAARLENMAKSGEDEAKGLRQLAEQMNKNIEKDIKEANSKKGGATSWDWSQINQARENAQRIEERASEAETALEELRQTAQQKKDAAKELKSMVSDRDKQLQTSVYAEENLVQDKTTKSQIFEQRDKLGTIQTQQITEREQKRKEQEKKLEQEKRQREEDARLKEQAGIGKSAASLVPKEASERFRRAVNAAAEGLQDGDQGGEIEQLAMMMEQLANAVRSKDSKTKIDIANLKQRIEKLRE